MNLEETVQKQSEQIQLLKTQLNNTQRRCNEYSQAYERLNHQLQELLRYRFGKKSERFLDPENPQQDFFIDKQALTQASQTVEQTASTVAAHQRNKKKKDTSTLPRVIEIIAVPTEELTCHCGCQKTVIRYETKELIDFEPAKLCIIEQRREVVACSKGCEKSLQTAPAPLQILPKIKASENLLAHIVVSKMHNHQPLYHLEKYGNLVDISRSSMARWVIQLTKPLQPLFNLMKDELIDYDIASIDATTLQVLKEPGRAAQTKSYVYCIRGGPPAKSVILYGYNHSKHKQFVDNWLEGFAGAIHMDADSFFDLLLQAPDVHASFCHAHARRKFEAIKKQAKKQGLAHEALRFYKKLYRIERQAKEEQLTAAERYTLRQKESEPLLEMFKQWLETNLPTVLPKSPLGKAFHYTLNHWEGLTHFLEDGRLEVDNNLTEQEIKPLVIARKNFMFSNSMEGAHALCLHFSLIRTALTHGLDPHQYYVTILKRLPHCQTIAEYEKLLPWNIEDCATR